jgi:hypothetical protein
LFTINSGKKACDLSAEPLFKANPGFEEDGKIVLNFTGKS